MYFDNQKMRNFENSIIDELKNEGIDFESIEVVKNNVRCKGVRLITSENVSPIIYYSDTDTIEQFMLRVRTALQSDVPRDSVRLLTDLRYVKSHVYLAAQKRGEDDIVKKEYLNLELYMRVMLDLGEQAGTGSVKVTPGLVEQLGITTDELWKCASANSHAKSNIRSMARSFCEDHGEEACYMLPSSTEEILVLQETALDNVLLTVDDLVHMVETINRDQVDPILRLEPAVYRYSVDTDEIDVVATL